MQNILDKNIIDKTIKLVSEHMKEDKSGHGMEHIMRVYNIAMKIAETEKCDKTLVALGSILHDCDDYKLFGEESQKGLINTRRILNQIEVDEKTKDAVIDIVKTIGYKKRLNGIVPNTIEGMIVSDADMCEAVGVHGILRTHQYTLLHGHPFFDKDIFPITDMNANKYSRDCSDTAVCHLFEKGLRLKKLMLTNSGKIEAEKRHNITVDFLKALFEEEEAPEWTEYLSDFLKEKI